MNCAVQASASIQPRVAYVAPARSTSPVAELTLLECVRDEVRVALPCPELQIVARFGVSAAGGLDVHAMGPCQSVRRKSLQRGQRSVMARLRLGASERVLGIAAPELTGRVVALEELWGRADAARLLERLAEASDTRTAASILENAILARNASSASFRDPSSLALEAAKRLAARPETGVSTVADELGLSERHLRRLFQATLGIGPKAYAKLNRFHRALQAARELRNASWADVAAGSGYFDQAHLIAEFRSVAGVTPGALLRELRNAGALGAGYLVQKP